MHSLTPIAKSLRSLFSLALISSISTATLAATEIGSNGIDINHDAIDSEYFIASTTTINGTSTNAPVTINDNIVTSLTNDGKINNSNGSAVQIDDFAGSFFNNNSIYAKEYGIAADGARTLKINNNGIIDGEAAGIYVASVASITNSGVIGSSADSYGILVDTGTATITNSGTITGNNSAVMFNTTNNQLILKNNSSLNGDVVTSVAGNTITLMDSGSEDSNFTGQGTGDGFSVLEMRGTEWTLGGKVDLVDTGAGSTLTVTRGKLILTGEINNTGDSLINNNATLQLGDGTQTATFNGKTLTDNGTLIFNQGQDSEFSPGITGSGDIIKNDNSTLTLSGNNEISGSTTLNSGTTLVTGGLNSEITVNNSAILATQGALTGNLLINAGGTFSSWEGIEGTSGTSTNTLTGNVNNAGTLNLASTSGTPGTQMTIDGDYNGESGSGIIMNTEAGGDSSPTDHLTITQNSSGVSSVKVNNAGGAGAQTINGIELISVGGISDATFALAAPVTAGKWEYDLKKKDNNWYLVSEKQDEPDNGGGDNNGGNNNNGSNNNNGGNDNGGDNGWNPPEVLAPETSAYLGNYMAAQQMFIHKRDDREQLLARSPDQNSGWMYAKGRYNKSDVDGDRGSYNTTTNVIQLGSDLFSRKSGKGEWHGGLCSAQV